MLGIPIQEPYLLIVQTNRVGSVKTTRRAVLSHADAIKTIAELPKHATVLLLKPYVARVNKRRAKRERRI